MVLCKDCIKNKIENRNMKKKKTSLKAKKDTNGRIWSRRGVKEKQAEKWWGAERINNKFEERDSKKTQEEVRK